MTQRWPAPILLGCILVMAACAKQAAKPTGAPSRTMQPQQRGVTESGSQSPEAMGATADSADVYGGVDSRRQDISELWDEIRDWRKDAGMHAEPASSDVQKYRLKQVKELRDPESETEPKTELCIKLSSIKEAICDNAESICRLADDLGGDAWANDKCESAKASCKEATERFTKCVDGEAAGGSKKEARIEAPFW